MKTIYITIRWKPGDVLFVNKTKTILQPKGNMSLVELSTKAAEMVRRKTAESAVRTHFGTTVEQVESELSYEVFKDNKESSQPFIKS